MGSKFQLILLDNVAEVIDSRHKTPNYTETGYPMVRVVDIKNGELDLKNTKRVTKDIYEDFSKGRSPQIGDLIISRVGSYGNISYVSKNEKFCLGQNTAFIIPNEKNSYLYYALISPFVQQQINDMAVGAVQKTISLKSIKNLKIPYPELNIRNIISKKLRVIDNRISTNDKINQTLEQMSQTLFKSWFVDFDPVIDNALEAGNPIPEALQSRAELRQKVRNSADFKLLPTEIRSLFPSEFEETEFGWVPKGWQIKSLDHIANFQNGLALQKFRPNNMDDDYLPVLKIADLRAGQITNDERARTDISDSCKVYDGDMIFSWSGTLMIDIWTGGNAALNQHLYKVTSKKKI
ncbi:restriction endonuclease subunit S [Escherichia coli]|uniref:restriction endonuclease subunit S n=1 Tax=Escherichia coli TaxID=562 RepID=UPI000DA5BAB3|nr:type I restriction-modification system (hsdS-like) [Escherichia coli]HBE5407262.1 restriction endonuclease subunit S [Escherichia coli]